MKRIDGSRIRRLRNRFRWVDHLVRARERYTLRQGDLLAAGVTYFVFLGLFPMLLLVVSVVGLVLSGHEGLEERLIETIQDAIPGPTGDQVVAQLTGAVQAAGVTGLVGLLGALYAGLRAVDKLRLGMERIWHDQPAAPRFLRDNLADLAALCILGALGLGGLLVTAAVSQETARVRQVLGLPDLPADGVLAWVLGLAVAMTVDVVVFLWLLRVVPSVPHPLRQLLPGAVLGAAGLEVLKLLGGRYLALISGSLTAAAFGGAVGILVWINLVARYAFFTAAWTATSPALRQRLPAPRPGTPPPSPRVPREEATGVHTQPHRRQALPGGRAS